MDRPDAVPGSVDPCQDRRDRDRRVRGGSCPSEPSTRRILLSDWRGLVPPKGVGDNDDHPLGRFQHFVGKLQRAHCCDPGRPRTRDLGNVEFDPFHWPELTDIDIGPSGPLSVLLETGGNRTEDRRFPRRTPRFEADDAPVSQQCSGDGVTVGYGSLPTGPITAGVPDATTAVRPAVLAFAVTLRAR